MDPLTEDTPFEIGAPILLVLSLLAGFFVGYAIVFANPLSLQAVLLILLLVLGCYFIFGLLAKFISREDSWHWIAALLIPSGFIFLLFIVWEPSRYWLFLLVLALAGLSIYIGAQVGKRIRPNQFV